MTFAAVAPRVAKLLPMLSSDKPGEVVAAVEALRRTLASGGADFHDLARAISNAVDVRLVRSDVNEPPEWGNLSPSNRMQWLHALRRNDDLLRERDAVFVGDMLERLRGGSPRPLSAKQVAYIDGLMQRAWFKGVRA